MFRKRSKFSKIKNKFVAIPCRCMIFSFVVDRKARLRCDWARLSRDSAGDAKIFPENYLRFDRYFGAQIFSFVLTKFPFRCTQIGTLLSFALNTSKERTTVWKIQFNCNHVGDYSFSKNIKKLIEKFGIQRTLYQRKCPKFAPLSLQCHRDVWKQRRRIMSKTNNDHWQTTGK